MATVRIIDRNVLPQTYAAVQAAFSDQRLRAEVWEAAKRGIVSGLARRIAFTAGGKAALDSVQATLSREWAEQGLDAVTVGDADPSVYGDGQVAAYLDQPIR
jgi:hypothetical protein